MDEISVSDSWVNGSQCFGPRTLPVLDLSHGRVVHAVSGNRTEYQPVSADFLASSRPADVAAALRHRFGFREAYVADLSAIAGGPPDWDSLDAIARQGFRLWIDAGLRNARQAVELDQRRFPWGSEGASGATVIAGLETLSGPEALEEMLAAVGPRRLVFSLDLKAGEPLGSREAWNHAGADEILGVALTMGIERFLILDLARVGSKSGPVTQKICRRLCFAAPNVEIASGGGVRGPSDLEQLRQAGCDVVLVASSLYENTIGNE